MKRRAWHTAVLKLVNSSFSLFERESMPSFKIVSKNLEMLLEIGIKLIFLNF
jgi:hypothetical protein